jgi:hypothetical protein
MKWYGGVVRDIEKFIFWKEREGSFILFFLSFPCASLLLS